MMVDIIENVKNLLFTSFPLDNNWLYVERDDETYVEREKTKPI